MTTSATTSATTTTVKLRKAAPDDAAQIAALGAAVYTATFGHSATEDNLRKYLDQDYTPAAILKEIVHESKDMIVAVDQRDKIVGFILLNRASSDPCTEQLEAPVELQKLYVGLDQHGKGVGRALTSTIESMAREEGFKHMWLGVWESNFGAQKAYERFGYSRIGEHEFDFGGEWQTDWVLFKAL